MNLTTEQIIDLLKYFGTIIIGTFAIYKVGNEFVKAWIDGKKLESEISNKRLDSEIYKHQADIARTERDMLTATQVAELYDKYEEVKIDIERVKENTKQKDEHLIEALSKLDSNLKELDGFIKNMLLSRFKRFREEFNIE